MGIQSFLQNTFLDMWDMVVGAVGDLEGVIGFEVCQRSSSEDSDVDSFHLLGHE